MVTLMRYELSVITIIIATYAGTNRFKMKIPTYA